MHLLSVLCMKCIIFYTSQNVETYTFCDCNIHTDAYDAYDMKVVKMGTVIINDGTYLSSFTFFTFLLFYPCTLNWNILITNTVWWKENKHVFLIWWNKPKIKFSNKPKTTWMLTKSKSGGKAGPWNTLSFDLTAWTILPPLHVHKGKSFNKSYVQ